MSVWINLLESLRYSAVSSIVVGGICKSELCDQRIDEQCKTRYDHIWKQVRVDIKTVCRRSVFSVGGRSPGFRKKQTNKKIYSSSSSNTLWRGAPCT